MKVHNPFRVAFVATLGVGLGLLLIGSIQTLSTILLYVGTALFLSLGLDPIVAWLERRRLPRWAAVLITILARARGVRGHHPHRRAGPRRSGDPARHADHEVLRRQEPRRHRSDVSTSWLHGDLPRPRAFVDDVVGQRAGVVRSTTSGSITGGVIGAGVALFAGLGGAFIVLILTIYFTASTPNLKRAGLPARARVQARAVHRPRRADHRLGRLLRHGAGQPRRHQRRPELHLPVDHQRAVPRGPRRHRVLLLADPARRNAHRLGDHRAGLPHPGSRAPPRPRSSRRSTT